MQDIKFDIFVSWTQQDKDNPLVNKLLDDLQKTGFIIWRDDYFIKPGVNWGEEIGRAISHSRFFLYIISKKITKWSLAELREAIAHQFIRQDYFVIPIQIDDIQIPNELQQFQVFDLRKYDIALYQIQQLILKEDEKTNIINFEIDKVQPDNSSIIQITDQVNDKFIEYFYNHPKELKLINRRRFEELIAELFIGFGYQVELTQKTRDGGKDIIAVKKDIVNVKYLIECKRPDPKNKVTIQVVKNLYATKVDQNATKGILATTAFFTRDAQLFFNRHSWELEPRDYNGLLDWIKIYLELKNKIYFR